jgi:hypothetical protein
MSILDEYRLGRSLFLGRGYGGINYTPTPTGYAPDASATYERGVAASDSADGLVLVFVADDTEAIELPTTVACRLGDPLLISIQGRLAGVVGVTGGGDAMMEEIIAAGDAAVQAANEAAAAIAAASAAQKAANDAEAEAATAASAAAAAQTTANASAAEIAQQAVEIAQAQQTADDAALAALTAQATADEAAASFVVALAQTADSIMITVAGEYATQTELGDVVASLQSQLAIRDSEIELSFQQQASATGDLAANLASDQAERASYYRFNGEQMLIGRLGSAFQTVIDNTLLGFAQDENEIAAIYNNRMYNTNLEVKNTFTHGLGGVGFFDWVLKQNGNLSLKFRSG